VTLLLNEGRLAHRHNVFRVEIRLGGLTDKRCKLGLIIVINLLEEWWIVAARINIDSIKALVADAIELEGARRDLYKSALMLTHFKCLYSI